MKGFFKIPIVLLFAFSANAQQPFFKTHKIGEPYHQAKTELICEDHNSALWFGTTEGLFLYDGIDFKPFIKEDSTSNHVRSIFRDSRNRLWVGYEDGSVFHFKKQKLEPWLPPEGTPNVPVNGFVEDGNGHIWMSTYGEGVYFFNEKRLYNFNSEDGLPGDDVYVIVTDPTGHVWLGTDGGITTCSFAGESKSIINFTKEDGLPDEIVQAILPNKEGQLWIGTYDGGIGLFDPKEKAFSYPLPKQEIGIVNCLELFEGTELWIGTFGNGVWRYSFTQGDLQPLSDFKKAKVADLHRDIEGNIWVVTNSHGICNSNRQFEFVPIDFKNVQSVLSDTKNRLWVGTSNGLFMHTAGIEDKIGFQQHLPQAKLNVLSLFEDEFGNIWIGTFGQGLYVYQPHSGAVRHLTSADGLGNGNILSMDGQNGQVWLATLGGVWEVKYKDDILKEGAFEFLQFGQEDGLGSNFIYKVFMDSQGKVWFGTDGKGLSVWEDGNIKNFPIAIHSHNDDPNESDFRLHAVYSITEDKNGHIWISTNKAGIFEYDGKTFHHLTLKEGIRNLEITSLATDANGQIIIVHPTGIDILTPDTKHLIYYDDEVGVQDIDPNLNAVCTDRFGNVWIGGKNAIVKYTALKEELEIHPRTLLNNVSIFLEPIDFQNINTFSHNQNNLVFNYMGLWYTDPHIVKYRYRMLGYDLDWIESKDRKANYSNLPAGDFTFEVTSTENDAWSDEPIIRYSFSIKKPFWLQWWFIALILPLLGGLFFWYQKSRDRRIQLVNLLEKDKAESQLAALKAQINPHFLFNSFNTLITVIEESPSLAVQYVENLSDFYRKIMFFRDKEIIPLRDEIELVENYCFLLEKRYGRNFRLSINLDESHGYIVPFTLQILVENAVKHNIISKSKPLYVSISPDGENNIVVTNNLQLKLTQEKSTHFGLQSLVFRYHLLGKRKVKVEETETEFRVYVPVIQ